MELKEKKLKTELGHISAVLRGCIFDLDYFCSMKFGKPVVITCLLRDADNQVERCRQSKFVSDFQHCVGEAGDLRSRHLTTDERNVLRGYAKHHWERFCRLRFHVKGTAPHFHLAVNKEFSDKATIWALIKNTEGAQDCFVG